MRRLYSSEEFDINEADVLDWYLSKPKTNVPTCLRSRSIIVTRRTLEFFKSVEPKLDEPKRPKKSSIIRRLKKKLSRTFSF